MALHSKSPPTAAARPSPSRPDALDPPSVAAARILLGELGAPQRLLRHVELVGEAADLLLAGLGRLGIPLHAEFVRIGVVLHDAGKVLHPAELEAGGSEHEPAGQLLLSEKGVSPALARVCVSHARWVQMQVTFEELLVALADKLWKGARHAELERRVVDRVAATRAMGFWDVFVDLDTLFEEVAAGGADKLQRSRM